MCVHVCAHVNVCVDGVNCTSMPYLVRSSGDRKVKAHSTHWAALEQINTGMAQNNAGMDEEGTLGITGSAWSVYSVENTSDDRFTRRHWTELYSHSTVL
jgi:hypothetical protein